MDAVDVVEMVRSRTDSCGEVGSRSQSECLRSMGAYSLPYRVKVSQIGACISYVGDLDQRLLSQYTCNQMNAVQRDLQAAQYH